MGNKLCCPRYGWCIRQQSPDKCKENHSGAFGGSKGHRRNLSATFQIPALAEEFVAVESQLNINTATEEELMTLPGINRQIAHNIVEYRRRLGGYKKVEDVALVSGVGATKLNNIRLEICVEPRKLKHSKSVSSSLDNISRSSAHARPSHSPKVNVNTANVFMLMKVKTISQTLAENIVAHRDKKGSFKSLDDLVKVKGLKPGMLSAIRPHLMLESEESSEPTTSVSRNDSGCHFTLHDPHNSSTESAAILINNNNQPSSRSGSHDDLSSLYGPLARKSFRSHKRPVLLSRQGRPLMRVASWNLDNCSITKAENPGVKEVVAMTALEDGLSIIAVQNLLDTEALVKICEELNSPTLPNVKKFVGQRGNWKCALSSQPVRNKPDGTPEYLGFLYDESRGIQVSNLAILDRCRTYPHPFDDKILLVSFKLGANLELVVVNMCMDVTNLTSPSHPTQDNFSLAHILDAVEEFMPGEKDILLAGSFHADYKHPAFTSWHECGFRSPMDTDKPTHIGKHNPDGPKATDIVWIGGQLPKLFTGQCGVVRDGLRSPWIPDGWSWGGLVSSHCPVWAEFYMTSYSYNDLDQSVNDTRSQKTGLDAIKMSLPMIGAGDL